MDNAKNNEGSEKSFDKKSFEHFFKKVNPTRRPRKYTPEQLWKKFLEYAKWVQENPLIETKAMVTSAGSGLGSEVSMAELPKMRAMTEKAFCLFAGLDTETFRRYKTGENNFGEFKDVACTIADCIYTIKFEGASANLLNAQIISRDLGLAEKNENVNVNYTSVPMTKEEIKQINDELENEY